MNGIYFDGRKDVTFTNILIENNTYGKNIVLEDHHVVVGEPGGLYLSHITTNNGIGSTIASSIHDLTI